MVTGETKNKTLGATQTRPPEKFGVQGVCVCVYNVIYKDNSSSKRIQGSKFIASIQLHRFFIFHFFPGGRV